MYYFLFLIYFAYGVSGKVSKRKKRPISVKKTFAPGEYDEKKQYCCYLL